MLFDTQGLAQLHPLEPLTHWPDCRKFGEGAMLADGFKCDIRARIAAEIVGMDDVAGADAVAMAGESVLVEAEPRAPCATESAATCAVL